MSADLPHRWMSGGGRRPGVSVIVPTRGHPALVDRLLASVLETASHLPDEVGWEILLVDDSPEPDRSLIKRAAVQAGARCLRGPRRVGAKRNLGARTSSFPLLVFLDSDCIATGDLLTLHVATHGAERSPSGNRVGAVAGPTLFDGPPRTWAWKVAELPLNLYAPSRWPEQFAEVFWAATSNLSVKRDAFFAVGGFDEETFTIVGGEDVDLGVRLADAGHATVCCKDAVALHSREHLTSIRQFQRKTFTYGRACVYNCMRQPRYAGFLANPVALAGIALALSLLPRLRSLARATPLALASWYVVDAVRLLRRRRSTRLDLALAAVSIDWSYHLGIVLEAVRRAKPHLAFAKYLYFDQSRFVPAPTRRTGERQRCTRDQL